MNELSRLWIWCLIAVSLSLVRFRPFRISPKCVFADTGKLKPGVGFDDELARAPFSVFKRASTADRTGVIISGSPVYGLAGHSCLPVKGRRM
jgi:hypothetical protein